MFKRWSNGVSVCEGLRVSGGRRLRRKAVKYGVKERFARERERVGERERESWRQTETDRDRNRDRDRIKRV